MSAARTSPTHFLNQLISSFASKAQFRASSQLSSRRSLLSCPMQTTSSLRTNHLPTCARDLLTSLNLLRMRLDQSVRTPKLCARRFSALEQVEMHLSRIPQRAWTAVQTHARSVSRRALWNWPFCNLPRTAASCAKLTTLIQLASAADRNVCKSQSR